MGFLRNLFRPATAGAPKELTTTNIKSLFRAIRGGELNAVREYVGGNPGFANVCASAPPKKDDGQSPLHVALKTGQFAIADYLIDQGADVNFIEQSQINEWRTPVLHDAIRAAILSSVDGRFDQAMVVVRKMLDRGADPNAVDSYGNSCLIRAILDARIRIRGAGDARPDGTMLSEIGEVFAALRRAGADVHLKQPDRASAVEETRGTVLEKFIA
jgi:hypothetical protein